MSNINITLDLRWSAELTPGPVVRCHGCNRVKVRVFHLELMLQGEKVGELPFCPECRGSDGQSEIRLGFSRGTM